VPSLEKDFGLNAPLLLWLCLQPTRTLASWLAIVSIITYLGIMTLHITLIQGWKRKQWRHNNKHNKNNTFKACSFQWNASHKKTWVDYHFQVCAYPTQHDNSKPSLLPTWSLEHNHKQGWVLPKKRVGCGCALNLDTKATFRRSSKQVFLWYPLGITRE
jgi:hypothetical protein